MSSSGTFDYNTFNARLIADLRANAGKATSGPFVGRPVLILTTIGAKTGIERETPLAYNRDGDRLVVIGSKGGAPNHPGWFHNLVANPVVTVEVDGEKFEARATVAEDEEHDRLYGAMAAKAPAFADYQRKTSRKIPAIILERISRSAAA